MWQSRAVPTTSVHGGRPDECGRPDEPGGALAVGSRVRTRWWWLLLVVALLAAAAWYALHPTPLFRGDEVRVQTPTAVPVYLGVLAAGDREIRLESVGWGRAALGEGDELEALVCRDGSVSATGDLEPFCAQVVPAEGATLGPGDQLVLRVTATQPGTIAVDGLRIEWREGLQRGAQVAGRDLEVRIGAP